MEKTVSLDAKSQKSPVQQGRREKKIKRCSDPAGGSNKHKTGEDTPFDCTSHSVPTGFVANYLELNRKTEIPKKI